LFFLTGFLADRGITIDAIIECKENGRFSCEWSSSCGAGLFDLPVPIVTSEVLVQILINLIENSIKFGAAQPEKRITVSTRVRDGWACVAVSDTGLGIPRPALKKVFDDFYRVDHKLTRATGGTGIGLALVKKVHRRHGRPRPGHQQPGPRLHHHPETAPGSETDRSVVNRLCLTDFDL
jgi:signal transduction histidine kinase